MALLGNYQLRSVLLMLSPLIKILSWLLTYFTTPRLWSRWPPSKFGREKTGTTSLCSLSTWTGLIAWIVSQTTWQQWTAIRSRCQRATKLKYGKSKADRGLWQAHLGIKVSVSSSCVRTKDSKLPTSPKRAISRFFLKTAMCASGVRETGSWPIHSKCTVKSSTLFSKQVRATSLLTLPRVLLRYGGWSPTSHQTFGP